MLRPLILLGVQERAALPDAYGTGEGKAFAARLMAAAPVRPGRISLGQSRRPG